jgi:hypothetical protein
VKENIIGYSENKNYCCGCCGYIIEKSKMRCISDKNGTKAVWFNELSY